MKFKGVHRATPQGSAAGFDLSYGGVGERKVCALPPVVGRTTLQRLNRDEYNNTLRDLLGIQSRPADDFPIDSSGTFDNNSDLLRLTNDQVNRYINAAEAVVNEAFTLNRARFMVCAQTTSACAGEILNAFLPRAFRRPVTAAEVIRLSAVVSGAQAQGQNFESGIKLALRAALSSPEFLFRAIKHPAPDSAMETVELDNYELASRLSYFLWSSMPDDALFAAARDGSLKNPAVMKQQVMRMLADSKARAFTDRLSQQWLKLGLLDRAQPDPAKFPEFSPELRADLMTETQLLLRDIVTSDANISQLLRADYSFINSRLADVYQISGVTGTSFRRVTLTGQPRQGLLGHAGILTVTAHSDHPSIVRRGKFVIGELLCDPPPPPPANIPPISGSETEQSAVRLTDSRCAGCHQQMDPIGHALHGFDVLGKFRTTDEAGAPVNDSGRFYNGASFKGPKELSDAAVKDLRFGQCVSKKLLAYALGRDLTSDDNCAVSQVAAQTDGGKPFSEAILGIVNSDVFRKQRGGGP